MDIMSHGQGLPLVAVCFIVLISQVDWTWGQNQLVNHYTVNGELCSSSCKTDGYSYNWCYTRSSWDYCSETQNTDYNDNPCLDNHPCGKYDYSYYWCYNKGDDWGKCGKVEPKKNLFISSTYQKICIDDCAYDKEYEYFWCYTEQGWDYCSPSTDVTYKNEQCRSGYTCDTHGYDYTWCWTGLFTHDYCGVIESVECHFNAPLRKKRTPNKKTNKKPNEKPNEKIYEIRDEENGQVIRFCTTQVPKDFTDGRGLKDDLSHIISLWDNVSIGNRPGTLITEKRLRIDLQGTINKNNQSYYNLQIQVNIPRKPGTSTTLAQVFIPKNADIPDRYVQEAFTNSFNEKSRIFIQTYPNLSNEDL